LTEEAEGAQVELPSYLLRYLKEADEGQRSLIERLHANIHTMNFSDALRVYEHVSGDKLLDTCLGLIDRYYLLVGILGRKDALHPWLYDRSREVEKDPDGRLDLWARDHYKLFQVKEKIPTPSGWKNHGDLLPGDRVFGADGKICQVIARTEVFESPPQHEIIFDDGVKIVAGDDHVWRVRRRTRKRIPMAYNKPGPKRLYRESVMLTTREIAQHDHRSDSRLMVEVAGALDLPKVALPIAPYVLGCWLGDGTAAEGSITCGDDIWSEIRKTDEVGPDISPHRKADHRTIACLRTRLRKGGLLNNKHIPAVYLRASIEQRLALLQGLMDTDGHCDTRGTATFVQKSEEMSRQVYELVASLGMKPHLRKVNGKHKGEPYPYWQLSFQAHKAMPPFRLLRKLERCLDVKRGRSAGRYIVSCERVEPSPGSCIQVDSLDGMYLAGKAMIPTHNSTIITFAGCIQEILRNPSLTVGIFSHTKDISRGFLRQIKRELEQNERLKANYADVLYFDPEKESPKWSERDGLIIKRPNNPKEATVEAWGLVDGQPTSRHYKLKIYDDVVTKESVATPEMVKKTTDAWELSDNLGSKGGRDWHIGTRYSYADSYQEMLDRQILIPRIYPATHNGKKDGRPVFLTEEAWALKKLKQSRTLSAQMLQNPAAGEDSMFELKWLYPYAVRPKTLNVYIMCDPSKGRTSRSDYTAISVIGLDANSNRYLLDGYRSRMKLAERWVVLRDLHKKWTNARGVNYVEVGYERYGAQSDEEHFEEMMRIEGYSFDITELAWPQEGNHSKEDRVERLVPDFKSGRFFLPVVVRRPGQGEFLWYQHENEIIYVPFKKTHLMRRMEDDGQAWRCAKSIFRKSSFDNTMYDLTLDFINEYTFFPFGSKKDLLDATSRFYDMDFAPPLEMEREASEEAVYVDT